MSDILTDEETAALDVTADTAGQPETPPSAAAEAPPEGSERPRDEQGRFTPKAAETAPEGEQPEGEQRQVPQQALHAEREKRKGIEAQLKAAQEQLAGIAAMRAKIASAQQPGPEIHQQPAEDPNGVEHLRARLAALEGHTQQSQRQQQLAQTDDYEMRVLSQQATADEATFRSVQPDYDDAISYLVDARARELAAYGMDPVSIQEAVRGEAADIVRTALTQGRSPAELSYQIAQLRGYRPAPAQKPAQQPANGAQATLDAIAKARAVSKSPGQGGGGSPSELNAATIAAMSDDEFQALYATPEGRKLIDAL